MQGARFEVAGMEYPVPTAFRVTDFALIREVTGMDWEAFVKGLEEEQEDPVLVAGLLAVAVSQANPSWKRDRVLRYLQGVELGQLKAYPAERDGDADSPPAQTGGNGRDSLPSTVEHSPTPNATGETTLASGGTPR